MPKSQSVAPKEGSKSTMDRTASDQGQESADLMEGKNPASYFSLSNHSAVPTVRLNSGYEMPVAGIGTYSLLEETCTSAVVAALRQGVRLIDTAYMYHNEEAVGKGIRQSGVPREEIFVITKLYPSQFDNAEAAIDEALRRLDVGYIDMMLLHHPGDGDVKAYKAMERAAAAGKIRSIGLSNWYIKEIDEFTAGYNHACFDPK